jgi:hypothetical protein
VRGGEIEPTYTRHDLLNKYNLTIKRRKFGFAKNKKHFSTLQVNIKTEYVNILAKRHKVSCLFMAGIRFLVALKYTLKHDHLLRSKKDYLNKHASSHFNVFSI